MSLKESLGTNRNKVVPGPKCGLHLVRTKLPEDELRYLDDAIAKIRSSRDDDDKYTTGHNCAWLQRALVAEGFPIKILTVQRHVAFKCACGY